MEPRQSTLHVVIEAETPAQTRLSLRRAARSRSVEYLEHHVASFDPLRGPVPPGDLLYSPAITAVAFEVVAALWQPGVATVFHGPLGPLSGVFEPSSALRIRGIPMPREVRVRSADRAFLLRVAEGVGGLPVIVRADGGEGGERVAVVDSEASLVSVVGVLLSLGHAPRIVAFVGGAEHFRVVVVAGKAVAAYRNPNDEGDFRSSPSDDPGDYTATPDQRWPEISALACRACGALAVDFGGVDVLRHASGRLYVLEVNTPCYFAQAERFGADVSGPLLDALLAGRR